MGGTCSVTEWTFACTHAQDDKRQRTQDEFYDAKDTIGQTTTGEKDGFHTRMLDLFLTGRQHGFQLFAASEHVRRDFIRNPFRPVPESEC